MIIAEKKKAISLSQLGELIGARIAGDAAYEITGVNALEEANENELSFFSPSPYESSRVSYEKRLQKSKAGILLVSSLESVASCRCRNFVLCQSPSDAFSKACRYFLENQTGSGFSNISPSAVVHSTATIEAGVVLAPHVVVDQGAVIGANTRVSSGCYIGPNVVIGKACTLHPRVVIEWGCVLRDRIILHAGVVIGSCGFGYTTSKTGQHSKLEQLGNVVIEEDVEIGANSTVDRARFKTTRIGRGTKIDNLVQIAHGVEVGEDNLIAGQTGIAGSTKLGNRVILAGQVGIVGHIALDDDVIVTAKTGVSKSLSAGVYASAFPAIPLQQHKRLYAHWRRLDRK